MDFRLSTSLSDVIHFPLGLGHDAAWTTSVKQTIVTDGTPNIMLGSDLGTDGDRGAWVEHGQKCAFIGSVRDPTFHEVRTEESEQT